ncbi:Pkinase-domain-containing protein [Hygrophoropsis aurantiaca]|uniref:Pkinase-domain-containing protein n=1 Tax=Hygrophoropsis aurantiaca TaxID=72124 RepID=A0ACB8AIQ5_9AGAM|nr:Pkinase-domain-containing protein [Hygrophoropsis aurantiaca]
MGANVSQQMKERAAKHKESRTTSGQKSSRFPSPSLGRRSPASGQSPKPEPAVQLVDSAQLQEPAEETAKDRPESAGEAQAYSSLAAVMAPQQPATVACQYRTGRTLGSGTYAIVKEAIHIKTGNYYACKVINKKLMEGREHMVRNEIAVLKRISSGHSNIVTLHDYFETTHNLYLCFDLCTGGELFDSICARGQYTEADAAELVRTIFAAVKYIHDCDIVHRDLKPENLLFRSKPEQTSEIMIADFGLSRVMAENKLSMLTEICGTPGYMAPEIFKKTGHGKPVDVWAMGVITYFLLAGYTPFDRDTQRQEMEAIIAGDYRFEPEEYWCNVSQTAREFVTECLTIDPQTRPTAAECLAHPWLTAEKPHFVESEVGSGQPKDLLPHVRKAFDARKTFRKAVLGMMAMKRMSTLRHHLSPEAQQLNEDVYQFKQESEKARWFFLNSRDWPDIYLFPDSQEVLEDINVIHHHNADNDHSTDEVTSGKASLDSTKQRLEKDTLKQVDDLSIDKTTDGVNGTSDVAEKLAA